MIGWVLCGLDNEGHWGYLFGNIIQQTCFIYWYWLFCYIFDRGELYLGMIEFEEKWLLEKIIV